MRLYTTFALAKAAGACADSYKRQAQRLGGINAYGKDTPIYLDDLAADSLTDALWCLGAVPPHQQADRDRLARLYAADCAEHVLLLFESRYPNDQRPRQAIETARRFANGQATAAELAAARTAARVAAAVRAAWDGAAAAVAAGDAAWAAAWDAAGDAAAGAARAAAGAARAAGAAGAWQQSAFVASFGEVVACKAKETPEEAAR